MELKYKVAENGNTHVKYKHLKIVLASIVCTFIPSQIIFTIFHKDFDFYCNYRPLSGPNISYPSPWLLMSCVSPEQNHVSWYPIIVNPFAKVHPIKLDSVRHYLQLSYLSCFSGMRWLACFGLVCPSGNTGRTSGTMPPVSQPLPL